MKWNEAFFAQGKSDYTVFVDLNKASYTECHQLHYLQMASEKLAKSYLCDTNNNPPKMTHKGLVNFLRLLKAQPLIRRQLGFENKNQEFNHYINSLLPFAELIENLAPEGINKPNPEYPWVDKTGKIFTPVDCKYSEIFRRHLEMNKFNKLVTRLFLVGISN